MSLPPYSRQLSIPDSNRTIYILNGAQPWARIKMKKTGRCLLLPQGDDPYQYTWPVNGCGIIYLDYGPFSEVEAQHLAAALMRDGADEVLWANMIANNTTKVRGS